MVFVVLVLTLTVLFVVLKLTKVVAWSWTWVLSPLWISVGIVVLMALLTDRNKQNRRRS